MGQLLVRKVDDDLIRRLKERAAMAGRTVEAEHRLLLEPALRPGKPASGGDARPAPYRQRGADPRRP
jgi:plasmid stability protein